jgi:hypothetical protein
MIDRFLYLSPAVNGHLDGNNPASLTRKDSLDIDETKALDGVRDVLSHFHSAQEVLAGEKTQTLPFVHPLYEDLLGALRDLCIEYPNLIHALWASIQRLEKYLVECRHTHLYTLAMGKFSTIKPDFTDSSLPVLHPGVKLEWVRRIWSERQIEDAKSTTLDSVGQFHYLSLHWKLTCV